MAENTTPPAAAPANTPTPASPAKKVDLVTPWVFDSKSLKPKMLESLKALKPDGNPDKVQLDNARAFAIAEVAALPEDSNLVTVKIEAQARPNFRQTNIMVWHEAI
jgi:hypothetical protein